jgi:hypothetical protein
MTSEPETLIQIMYSLNYVKMLGVHVQHFCWFVLVLSKILQLKFKYDYVLLYRNITN